MDSPPLKSKPAIPSHLANGPPPLSVSTEARDKKERDSLYAQIQNSNRGRQAVNFDEPNRYFPKSSTSASMDGSSACERRQMVYSESDVEGYGECNPTRTPLATSRAQSPYIQHPTIDFNGLSWPSKWTCRRETTGRLTEVRSRNTPKEGGDRGGKGRTSDQAVRRCKDDLGMRGRGPRSRGPA